MFSFPICQLLGFYLSVCSSPSSPSLYLSVCSSSFPKSTVISLLLTLQSCVCRDTLDGGYRAFPFRALEVSRTSCPLSDLCRAEILHFGGNNISWLPSDFHSEVEQWSLLWVLFPHIIFSVLAVQVQALLSGSVL